MRLQLHRDFKFVDAIKIIPYLDALNISHIYASPILKARAGSMHGYDVVDPTQINPELGGEQSFRDLIAALRARGLGLIIDIVPNHMAVGGDDNAWWLDLLQNGRTSAYAKFFDIDWSAPGLDGKIMAPFLGAPYAEVLAKGDLALTNDTGRYEAKYFQHRFPIRREDWNEIEMDSLAAFESKTAAGRLRLHQLLECQYYRLAWWKSANDAINWRRFFDINELAAIRCEDDDVFEATHQKIFQLYKEGLIDGVRIDHIDGLTDPRTYCHRLRTRLDALALHRPTGCSARPYIVVEKILGAGEKLPADWDCEGTTGYDFMDHVARVLHDRRGAAPLTQLWHVISGRPSEFFQEEDCARRESLARSFSAQLESLVGALSDVAKQDLASRDLAEPAIRRVVVEILVQMRVYRTYARPGSASKADEHHLAQAVQAALRSCLPADRDTLRIVADWLGGMRGTGDQHLRAEAIRKFQQLSAPLAAKAVEDTAFYRRGALLSRLDVGFDPSQFGGDVKVFHHDMKGRAARFPHGMLATATHDHKRGEDVRARLAVLSEIPEVWETTLCRWLKEAAPLFSQFKGGHAPSKGSAAILLEMIIGAWPMDLRWDDASGCDAFEQRLGAWQSKALREAKLETDWVVPNERYENAARHFLNELFRVEWRQELSTFVNRIAAAGAVKGLSQTFLKLTCPGVPDLYQGTEFWDFSLVDPDNRRPVDFAGRAHSLGQGRSLAAITQEWRDGRIKQAIIARVLEMRRRQPELFQDGDYCSITVHGSNADGLIAFGRRQNGRVALIVAPRFSAALLDQDRIMIPSAYWDHAELELPAGVPTNHARNVLTGKIMSIRQRSSIAYLLDDLPVALILFE
jgi:malto-oligosyltrehalose synthase